MHISMISRYSVMLADVLLVSVLLSIVFTGGCVWTESAQEGFRISSEAAESLEQQYGGFE